MVPAPLKPLLPKSLRPVPKSPPLVQSFEMVLVSIVTAPVFAMARPQMILAVVFRVMLWSARMFPANVVLVPRVAELPTSQYTPLFALPFNTLTVEPLAVVSVLPIWNTNRLFGWAVEVEGKRSRQLSRRRKLINARHQCKATKILSGQVHCEWQAREKRIGSVGIVLRLVRDRIGLVHGSCKSDAP